MISIYRNLVFFLFGSVAAIGAFVGMRGIDALAKSIVGQSFGTGSASGLTMSEIFLSCGLWGLGAIVGTFGVTFVIILPVIFLYPTVCEVPMLARSSPSPLIRRFLNWYSDGLKRCSQRL